MSEKFVGGILPQEAPGKKPRTKSTIEVGEAKARLIKRKSEYPGHSRVEITFDDIYKGELADQYGWNEDQINSFDVQLFAKLQGKGGIVNWEDKEFFTVDVPEAVSQDVISDVESALRSALSSPLFEKEDIEKAGELHREIQDRQEELARQELAKIRTRENFFQAYKEKPHATSSADHEGYCSVTRVKIKKASGITYDDEEFLGHGNRKIVIKPNMVILSVSVSGEPFDRLYNGRVIEEEQYGFADYESELQKIIQGLQSQQQDEIVKISHRVSAGRGQASGEQVKLLCTDEFANKVAEYIKGLYSDLHDISKEGKKK